MTWLNGNGDGAAICGLASGAAGDVVAAAALTRGSTLGPGIADETAEGSSADLGAGSLDGDDDGAAVSEDLGVLTRCGLQDGSGGTEVTFFDAAAPATRRLGLSPFRRTLASGEVTTDDAATGTTSRGVSSPDCGAAAAPRDAERLLDTNTPPGTRRLGLAPFRRTLAP